MTVLSHPLNETLREANQNEHWLPLALTDIDARQSLAALVGDDQPILDRAAVFGNNLGADDPWVGPTLLFEKLVDLIALALIGPYAVGRRVPLAAIEAIQPLFADDGRPEALRLLPGPFACLPDDEAAQHALARPLDTAEALLSCLRERLVALSAPLVQSLARPARRGERTQWRGVVDKASSVAFQAGTQTGSEAAGIALAEALCDGREPLVGRPHFVPFEYRGIRRTHMVRNSCCQLFRVPNCRVCFTCPLTKARDRQRVWRQRYDERLARQ